MTETKEPRKPLIFKETPKPPTFSVYVPAVSVPAEIERVAHWTERLKKAGIAVTSTWPSVIALIGAANPRDACTQDRRRWAAQCLWEVGCANALWLMCPPPSVLVTDAWAWVELGTAYTRAQLIVSS